MRVLHIIIGLNVGGAENSLKRLILCHKQSSDYQHLVMSLTTNGKIGEQLQALGVEVHTLGLKSLLGAPAAFIQIMKFIRQAKPDIVQTWMYHADFIGGLAGWIKKKKVIWSIRNTNASVGSGTASSTRLIMYACAFLSSYIPKRIVCVADAAKASHRNYGYNEKIMSVISNGYDVNKIHQEAIKVPREFFRGSLNIKQGSIVIGSVGRYNDYKDHPNFIKAAKILLESYSNLKFLLIGKDVDYDNQLLVQLVNDTGYKDSFILLGERNDVPSCLLAMDIFCLHSISEGFPNVLGEAMCLGLPCITTDVGDAAIMVGKQELVVPHSQPVLLAKGLQGLLDLTQNRRLQIGQELNQFIKSEYSMDKVQQAYETLYQQVFNS